MFAPDFFRALGEGNELFGFTRTGNDDQQVTILDAGGDDLPHHTHVVAAVHQAHGKEVADQLGAPCARNEDALGAVQQLDQFGVIAAVGRRQYAGKFIEDKLLVHTVILRRRGRGFLWLPLLGKVRHRSLRPRR